MADNKNMEINDDTMAKVTGGTGSFPSYDMMGFVVSKLPTENYANHYNVKGDNDEIFICFYAGDDLLAPGTEVYMNQVEDGWAIQPAWDY